MDKQILMQPVEATELTAVDGGFPSVGEIWDAIVKAFKGLAAKSNTNTCDGGGCIQTTNIN